MGKSLASEVDSYVTNKIETYEPRVEVYKANVASDYINYSIILQYYLRIKSTDEILALEPISVPIGN